MSVEIQGLSELLTDLDRRLGPQRTQQISDLALKQASRIFESALKSEFQTFKDTGASHDEITFTEPYDKDGARTITVHWKGPKGRYRVIHLNEFGTVKNPNPPGKGAIARALLTSESAFKAEIRRVLGGAF
jgi:hypothetical protein